MTAMAPSQRFSRAMDENGSNGKIKAQQRHSSGYRSRSRTSLSKHHPINGAPHDVQGHPSAPSPSMTFANTKTAHHLPPQHVTTGSSDIQLIDLDTSAADLKAQLHPQTTTRQPRARGAAPLDAAFLNAHKASGGVVGGVQGGRRPPPSLDGRKDSVSPPLPSGPEDDRQTTTPHIPERLKDPVRHCVYRIGEYLGKGGFASCYEALQLCDADGETVTQRFAVKVIDKTRFTKPRHRDKVMREMDIHRGISHSLVLRLHSSFEDKINMYMILDYCQLKSLVSVVRARISLTEPEAREYARQLLLALVHLHENAGVLHRDVKLGNMMLTGDMRVKLGDFGLATTLGGHVEADGMQPICGTPNYIAPEVLQRRGHSQLTEAWAVGCCVYAMLFGRPPFESGDLQTTYELIERGTYRLPNNGCSRNARKLIQGLLQIDPSRRLTCRDALNHAFFSDAPGVMLKFEHSFRAPHQHELLDCLPSCAASSENHVNRPTSRRSSSQNGRRPPGPGACPPGAMAPLASLDDLAPPLSLPRRRDAYVPAENTRSARTGRQRCSPSKHNMAVDAEDDSDVVMITPTSMGAGRMSADRDAVASALHGHSENAAVEATRALSTSSTGGARRRLELLQSTLASNAVTSNDGVENGRHPGPMRPSSSSNMVASPSDVMMHGHRLRALQPASSNAVSNHVFMANGHQMERQRLTSSNAAAPGDIISISDIAPGATTASSPHMNVAQNDDVATTLTRYADVAAAVHAQHSSRAGVQTALARRDVWVADAVCADNDAPAFVYVTKWIDYSNRYGFGCQLSDGSVSVNFLDGSVLTAASDGVHYEYIPPPDGRAQPPIYWATCDPQPAFLADRVTVMALFYQYMDQHLIKGYDGAESTTGAPAGGRFVSVIHWRRQADAMILQLSDGTCQVNFLASHVKLVLGGCRWRQGERGIGQLTLMHIDEQRQASTYRLVRCASSTSLDEGRMLPASVCAALQQMAQTLNAEATALHGTQHVALDVQWSTQC